MMLTGKDNGVSFPHTSWNTLNTQTDLKTINTSAGLTGWNSSKTTWLHLTGCEVTPGWWSRAWSDLYPTWVPPPTTEHCLNSQHTLLWFILAAHILHASLDAFLLHYTACIAKLLRKQGHQICSGIIVWSMVICIHVLGFVRCYGNKNIMYAQIDGISPNLSLMFPHRDVTDILPLAQDMNYT